MSIKNVAARVGGWIAARAREKSTWAGLVVIATAIGGPAAGLAINNAGTIAGVLLGAGAVIAPTSSAEA